MKIPIVALSGLLLFWSASTMAQSTASVVSPAQADPTTAPALNAAQQQAIAPVSGSEIESGDLALETDSDLAQKLKTIAEYERVLKEQQLYYGAYEGSLAEIYAGLGATLQSLDQHKQAIEAFNQAIHIQRVNGGLYSLEGVPLIEKLIDSLVANGDWDAIDDRFHFLLQLHAHNYDALDPGLLPALDKAIRWHMHAFNENYGKDPLKHILTARDLLRISAKILESNFGNTDPRLAHQLNGAAVADYYAAIYQAENGYADTLSPRINEERNIFAEERNRQEVILDGFATGKRTLQHLVDLNTNNPDTPVEDRALAVIKLADWHLLFRKSQTAAQYYQQAFDMLQSHTSSHPMLTEQFGKPVLLPQTADLDLGFPVPKTGNRHQNQQKKGFVLLGFNVSDKGKALNVEVVDTSPDHNTRQILDARRILKFSQFRPQIADGHPVATNDMKYLYTYAYTEKGKSGKESAEDAATEVAKND